MVLDGASFAQEPHVETVLPLERIQLAWKQQVYGRRTCRGPTLRQAPEAELVSDDRVRDLIVCGEGRAAAGRRGSPDPRTEA